MAPFIRYLNLSLENEGTGDEATFSAFGGGVTVGRQWIFSDIVALDLFLGPAYFSGSLDVESGTGEQFDVAGAFDGFTVRGGINLGIAF